MNPNLDIWRCVKGAVRHRGGLVEFGENMLWTIWQKSHSRATMAESPGQKELRRGDAVADMVANDGRRLHEDVSGLVAKTKVLEDISRNWALWIGTAAKL